MGNEDGYSLWTLQEPCHIRDIYNETPDIMEGGKALRAPGDSRAGSVQLGG